MAQLARGTQRLIKYFKQNSAKKENTNASRVNRKSQALHVKAMRKQQSSPGSYRRYLKSQDLRRKWTV